jgi:hypothetical protein
VVVVVYLSVERWRRVRVKGRRNVMEKCEGREFVMIYFVLFSMNDVRV